jgi:hypothetical protein
MIRTLVLVGLSAALTAAIVLWGIDPIATVSGLSPDRRLLKEAAARADEERERAQQAFDEKYAEMETFTDKVGYEWAERRSHWLAVEQLKQDLLRARRDHEVALRELAPLHARANRVDLIAGLVLWPLCYLVLARSLRRWTPRMTIE